MSIITKVLKATCVYWAPGAYDAFGQATFESPVELNCRWADTVQEVMNDEGTLVLSKANVMVNEDVEVQGVLMLGELSDIVYPDDPKRNTNAYEIIQFSKIPNIKYTEYVRVAFL